ncbi:hypothetical protein L6452_03498 [Arctium lappa]|uniref:Uncharacterized protein n=1 Tax=Arctium lappa TaxID=4217 RepID=A0ACB9FNL5_ARCLA|nr:hypothetical protein L6452_03498 [Arctium lappa]
MPFPVTFLLATPKRPRRPAPRSGSLNGADGHRYLPSGDLKSISRFELSSFQLYLDGVSAKSIEREDGWVFFHGSNICLMIFVHGNSVDVLV